MWGKRYYSVVGSRQAPNPRIQRQYLLGIGAFHAQQPEWAPLDVLYIVAEFSRFCQPMKLSLGWADPVISADNLIANSKRPRHPWMGGRIKGKGKPLYTIKRERRQRLNKIRPTVGFQKAREEARISWSRREFSPCLDGLNEWVSPPSQKSLSSPPYNDTEVNTLPGVRKSSQ